jgi:hypothetical protein
MIAKTAPQSQLEPRISPVGPPTFFGVTTGTALGADGCMLIIFE